MKLDRRVLPPAARTSPKVLSADEATVAPVEELAAVLAHEVKNPVAAVSGILQILSPKLAPEDRAIVNEALGRLDALAAMMTDLLLYARPLKPHRAAVDVTALVRGLVDSLGTDPAWQAVSCDVKGRAAVVYADSALLKAALKNILDNALHAMSGRGKVTVAMAKDAGGLRIDVTDTGTGLRPEVLSRLFTPFFTTKARGTGPGLATALRIAQLHQGDITVVASSSSGSTIRLSLSGLPATVRSNGAPQIP